MIHPWVNSDWSDPSLYWVKRYHRGWMIEWIPHMTESIGWRSRWAINLRCTRCIQVYSSDDTLSFNYWIRHIIGKSPMIWANSCQNPESHRIDSQIWYPRLSLNQLISHWDEWDSDIFSFWWKWVSYLIFWMNPFDWVINWIPYHSLNTDWGGSISELSQTIYQSLNSLIQIESLSVNITESIESPTLMDSNLSWWSQSLRRYLILSQFLHQSLSDIDHILSQWIHQIPHKWLNPNQSEDSISDHWDYGWLSSWVLLLSQIEWLALSIHWITISLILSQHLISESLNNLRSNSIKDLILTQFIIQSDMILNHSPDESIWDQWMTQSDTWLGVWEGGGDHLLMLSTEWIDSEAYWGDRPYSLVTDHSSS